MELGHGREMCEDAAKGGCAGRLKVCAAEVEAGQGREMREGGKKKIRPRSADSCAVKVQACDAGVERQRARQDSATRLKEVGFALYFELREGRVAALDAMQQLRRQVRVMIRCCIRSPVAAHDVQRQGKAVCNFNKIVRRLRQVQLPPRLAPDNIRSREAIVA